MPQDHAFPKRAGLMKRFAPFIAGLTALIYVSYHSSHALATENLAPPHATIQVTPAQPSFRHAQGQLQPGTPVRLSVSLRNDGSSPTSAGQLYVRYAFSPPLDKETGSVIFETEKKNLPSLPPGEQRVITFDTLHLLSSLLDFIREDWSMREYQAIVLIDGKESSIGTLTLTVSAHYYAQET